MEIINPSDNVMDLGICMSSNCSFESISTTCVKKMYRLVWLDFMNVYHQRNDYDDLIQITCPV